MFSITAVEKFLVRRRVALGGLAVLVAIVFGDPTWVRWSVGLAIAVAGEALRVWAAGHLEKNSEVTTSGPYRYMRHPLYSGSAIITIGAMLAAHNFVVNLLALAYILTTVPAAMRAEEAHLRSVFGDLYDRYTRAEAPGVERAFSFERVMRNKEYRAILGVLVGFGILALKLLLDL